MSLRTPILITPSDTCACAAEAANARETAAAILVVAFTANPPLLTSDSEIFVHAAHVGLELGARDHVDHAAVLDDVVPVGELLREAEVLLDQHDGEALVLQPLDGAADLLHDHRREALGGLVE